MMEAEAMSFKEHVCFNVSTNTFIGYSSVAPLKGEEHYFGDILYVCISSQSGVSLFRPVLA